MMTRLTYRAVNGDKVGIIGKRGLDLNGMDHFGNARHALICRNHMAARICQIGDSAAIARAQPQPQAACMSDKVNRSAPCQGACVKQNRLLRQPIQPAARPKSQIFSNLGQFTASPTGAVRGFVATAFTAAPSDRLNDSVSPPVTPAEVFKHTTSGAPPKLGPSCGKITLADPLCRNRTRRVLPPVPVEAHGSKLHVACQCRWPRVAPSHRRPPRYCCSNG